MCHLCPPRQPGRDGYADGRDGLQPARPNDNDYMAAYELGDYDRRTKHRDD